jgi:hypothetical protein
MWEVGISGDNSDLATLSLTFASGSVILEKVGERYVLRADEFEDLDNAAAVRSAASSVVTALNAAAQLLLGSHPSIKVGSVTRIHGDGRRDITMFAEPANISISWLRAFDHPHAR